MTRVGSPYPHDSAGRTRWILDRRPSRQLLDPYRPYDFCLEEERTATGEIASVATVFLTNRECPWRCLMCDLWRNTVTETVPLGAIPAQIDVAIEHLSQRSPMGARPITQLKLYNSGSFFDPKAIPSEDHETIARRVSCFERVIVECHPALVGEACLRFRDLLQGQLEVAMGLETVHEQVLEKLNKRMTVAQFGRAAEFLRSHGIGLRVFVLVQPPFLDECEGFLWVKRSIVFAFDQGATVVSLIPTRAGNGALDVLMTQSQFTPPKLAALELAQDYGISLGRGRVFADLWDLKTFADCADCFSARAQRLSEMNLRQERIPAVRCSTCEYHLESRL